jgi:molybdopterin converting factor small subunit|tara:strand:+ start:1689 stop:1946 length:258 start_codon:yes stop_codon:yes gene_type:complete
MNNVKLFGNISKINNKNNLTVDFKDMNIYEMLDKLSEILNLEKSFLNNENLLIAINNIEISALNEKKTVIETGDLISIISINHGG